MTSLDPLTSCPGIPRALGFRYEIFTVHPCLGAARRDWLRHPGPYLDGRRPPSFIDRAGSVINFQKCRARLTNPVPPVPRKWAAG